MKKSAKNRILFGVYGYGRGKVFSAQDFFHKFKRENIDEALSSLVEEGKIRRIIQGVYDYPLTDKIKDLSPDMEKVAEVLAKKFNWKINPTGDLALFKLGLKKKFDNNFSYISNGPYRKYVVFGKIIEFKKVNKKEDELDYNSSLVVQAIKTVGKDNIDKEFIQKLKNKFSYEQWMEIKQKLINVTRWVYEIVENIVNSFKKEVQV